MKISLAAFTDRGEALAARLTGQLKSDGNAASYVRCGRKIRAADWTAARFYEDDALIFVGAAGIAVRSIAPHIRSKSTDPAVVVIDENGQFVIPILSGHLGGANALASRLASLIGGAAVITTATDCRGVFAFDDWARRMNCSVENTDRIRTVSGALLAGDEVTVVSDYAISGEIPPGIRLALSGEADVRITISGKDGDMLRIVPHIVCVGIGCRRGIPCDEIDKAVNRALAEANICRKAITAVASIDLKAGEEGIREYARMLDVPYLTYSAAELTHVPGRFTSSAFVRSVTGVDNVCERAAVRAAMEGDAGTSAVSKRSGESACEGESGEKSFVGESGEKSFVGESGEKSFEGESGEKSFVGESGEKSFGGELGEKSFGGESGEKSFGGESGERAFGGKSGERLSGGESDESASGGELICRKIAGDGVTVALAVRATRLRWDA